MCDAMQVCPICTQNIGPHDWEIRVHRRAHELDKQVKREELTVGIRSNEDEDLANMCPNCVTPWKCNGPHEWPCPDKVEPADRGMCWRCGYFVRYPHDCSLDDPYDPQPDDQGLEPPAPSAEETLVDIALLALSRLSELLEGRTSR
jgi:hypothetical protein